MRGTSLSLFDKEEKRDVERRLTVRFFFVRLFLIGLDISFWGVARNSGSILMGLWRFGSCVFTMSFCGLLYFGR